MKINSNRLQKWSEGFVKKTKKREIFVETIDKK